MTALELTPQDVSAAVETDVTQLARKCLLPPQKRREPDGPEETLGNWREGRAAPGSSAPSRVSFPPTGQSWRRSRETSSGLVSPPRARPRGQLRPLLERAARSCGSELCRGRARRRRSRS